jgi:hypothetical protein
MRQTETGCPRVSGFLFAHIMSYKREKTLYIDVAVFGKKCYTNARRTSNHSQQGLHCEEVLSLA